MSHTVTAFFDSRADAEAAARCLRDEGIDADRVRIVDRDEPGEGINSTPAGGTDQGLFESLTRMFMPGEDAAIYHEGLLRGGYLLTVDVDEADAARAERILDEAECVDLQERTRSWRDEGWTPRVPAEAAGGETGFRQPDRGGRVRTYARNTFRG